MRTAIDFVSETTGRIHLQSVLDMAPEGLSRKEARLICEKMHRFQRELQCDMGPGRKVRLTIDSYEGSVFWYLVLFRPVLFRKDDPLFGSRNWSVYEIINSAHADSLGKTDLGLYYDNERLVLIWPEAFKGILTGFEDCPSWKKIVRGKAPHFWKNYADSFSFTIPTWQLKRENFMQNIWQRQGHRLKYRDITVLGLNGIEVPSKTGQLPVAKRARFAWFYTKPRGEDQSRA